jgi:hypothetical protein
MTDRFHSAAAAISTAIFAGPADSGDWISLWPTVNSMHINANLFD